MSVLKMNSDNFQKEVLEAKEPVLIDFWAEWCGPCQMFGPVVDEIAEELGGKLKVGKVNVDEAPEIARKYRVLSIPTIKLFAGGEEKATNVGALGNAELKAWLSKNGI